MSPTVHTATFEAALSEKPLASLDSTVKDFLRESFLEGCNGHAELEELLTPYLLDSGLVQDESEATTLCRRLLCTSADGMVGMKESATAAASIAEPSRRQQQQQQQQSALAPGAAMNAAAAAAATSLPEAKAGAVSVVGEEEKSNEGYKASANVKKKVVPGAKAASRVKGRTAMSAALKPGAELELQGGADSDVAVSVARALKANGPALCSANGADVDYIAASFVAYAVEKDPKRLPAWRDTLAEVLADVDAHLDDDEAEHTTAVERVIEQLVRLGALQLRARTLELGEQVLAVLSEDDDWHPALVDALLADGLVKVIFIEYGKPQTVEAANVRLMEDVVDDEEDSAELEEGTCEMCDRYMLLTFHHLIPKDTHRRYMGKRLPEGVEGEPTRCFLNTHGTMICRACHNTVHHFATNDELGARYNTLAKLLAEPYIMRWIDFVKKRSPGLKSVAC